MDNFYFKQKPEEYPDVVDTTIDKASLSTGNAETKLDQNGSNVGIQPSSIVVLGKHHTNTRDLTVARLTQLYFNSPIGFLRILADVSPFLSSTITTVLRLALGDRKFKITIRKGSVEKNSEILELESAEAENFFKRQPREVGDLPTVIGKLLQEIMFFADGCCFEGIFAPDDPEGEFGYDRIALFSANTVNIAYDSSVKKSFLVQKKSDGSTMKLSDYHVYWQPNDPTVDAPSGKYALSSALAEGLGELITARDLRDSVKAAGSPSRVYTYDRDGLLKTAIETLGLGIRSSKVTGWVKSQIALIEAYAQKRKNAETVVVAKDVQVTNVDPANFTNVVPALETLWTRFASSINTHGNLLGFGEATKASLQYQLVATNIDSGRGVVLALLEKFLEFYFLLQGKEVTATIEAPTIHLTDELIAQNTAQMKFVNALMKYAMGLISKDEFSKIITGHLPSGEEIDGALEALLKIAKNGGTDNNDSRDTAKSGGKTGKPKES